MRVTVAATSRSALDDVAETTYIDTGHYNSRGNEIIASRLAKKLRDVVPALKGK